MVPSQDGSCSENGGWAGCRSRVTKPCRVPMPLILVPGEVQRIAVAVAVLQDQAIEVHKSERRLPSVRNEALVLPQSEKSSAAQANVGRVLQKLDAVLAGWELILILE